MPKFTPAAADEKPTRQTVESAFPVTDEEFLLTELKRITNANGLRLEQEHVDCAKELFIDGRNILVTGQAGSGKSTFVREMLVPLMQRFKLTHQTVCSTGIATTQVPGSRTVHSFFGIGLGVNYGRSEDGYRDVEAHEVSEGQRRAHVNAFINKWANSSWTNKIAEHIKSMEVIIFDEISMTHGMAILDLVDQICRRVREKPEEAFGGIRMIFVGDFLQLPPVHKTRDGFVDWAFKSKAWHFANVSCHELKSTHRQASNDMMFIAFLNQIRVGLSPTGAMRNWMQQFVRNHITPEEAKRLTFLVPTNAEVDEIYEQVLDFHEGEEHDLESYCHVYSYHCRKDQSVKKLIYKIEANNLLKRRLKVKTGMLLLTTENDPEGRYVNGTRVRFEGVDHNGQLVCTVLKFDPSTKTLSDGPEVKLSRKRFYLSNQDAESNYLLDAESTGSMIQSADNADMAADVETLGTHGLTGFFAKPFLMQYPVIPACAMTIHKGQGQTLDEVMIDPRNMFADGHAYVALSRLSTSGGLNVMSSDFPIQVSDEALRFLSTFCDNIRSTTGS